MLGTSLAALPRVLQTIFFRFPPKYDRMRWGEGQQPERESPVNHISFSPARGCRTVTFTPIFFFSAIVFLTCVCVFVEPAESSTFYVSPTGNDANAGDLANPLATIQEGLDRAAAGDSVLIQDGIYNESLVTDAHGTAADRITVRAVNSQAVTVSAPFGARALDVRHAYTTFEGLIFDGNFTNNDLIRVRVEADYLHFRNNLARNGARDGIDLGENDTTIGAGYDFLEGVLIENSRFHHFLWFDTSQPNNRNDAHAIVAGGVQDFTIRDTEAFFVSGDSLQLQDGAWDDVLVDGVRFWNGPLPEPAGGFAAGVNPGENAIDTKQDDAIAVRGRLTVRDSEFFGWDGDLITNSSALNLKERVDVVLDGNLLHDNEIALRLRGRTGDNGAHVTVQNQLLYSNLTALRYEDSINNLHVFNNTFGADNVNFFQSAPTFGGSGNDFQVLNNLFLAGALPTEAGLPSNLAVDASSFVNVSGNNYHLAAGSPAIDSGLVLGDVVRDFDGVLRPIGLGYDIGAFEFVPEPTTFCLAILAIFIAGSCSRRRLRVETRS